MLAALAHIDAWVFDMDNTLYPASANLFAPVERRMTDYIVRLTGLAEPEAAALREGYFLEHGTTLAGLMAAHGVDPHDFLDYVHDVEMDVLEENAPLAALIAKLPGRKLVFTNGDLPYAERVLGRLGLGDSFEGVHDIHAMALQPKPAASAYAGLCAAYGIDPARSLFADDMARNLAPAKVIGMTTLWIDNGSQQENSVLRPDGAHAFIDYTTADLTGWLAEILGDTV
ncbi:pyrimidine 5'-nucleotidase [Sphingomonas donggukensis]|uniref:Pyrimidine 5'-nucleotidase n=1 Tax=Sphingomonas donggukensis TaxID=2949093 RepID=A0ABY4TV63_9SPHN|nr:pyrimidine 5'-nucleotidase [Sphingomonas donggukensis]URW75372.1 pyrimidine 5'-nucleotidase [Sphingomonas donggukensis]